MGDAGALAIVHVRSWQATYRGQVPQNYLDGLDPAQRKQGWEQWIRSDQPPWGTTVLEHDTDGVVGLINVAPSRDSDTDPLTVGEVIAVYLLPEHWGHGGGRVLMNDGRRRMADAGCRDAVLWVLETNHRARRFYEADGWQADGSIKTDDSRGFPMREIRYRRHIAA
ncbi:GNAT family N-acetyltransferase [Catellatospora chokoriensis]|uniref:N-acetyltransferase n=1 Tax=Catellatospora chokoriensis TaxID=310353 RepID=A0A8J3NTF7_9ACTN|nr:N-acetyltransferase [Catellatospora chokoriensis]